MLKTPRCFKKIISGCFLNAVCYSDCTTGNWEIKQWIRPLCFLPFTEGTAQKYQNIMSIAPDG